MIYGYSYTAVGLSAVGSLIVYGIYYYISQERRRRRNFENRGLKYVSLPNLMWAQFRGRRLEVIELETIRKHGTVFGSTIFMGPAILIAEPDLIQAVLVKEFTSFTDRRRITFFNDEFTASFLSVVSGEKWKRIRSVITPTFAAGKLKQMQPRIDMALETLIENFNSDMKEDPESQVDIKRLFGGFTMNTIIQVSYGIRVDSLNDDHPIIKYAKKVFQNLGFKNLVIFWLLIVAPKVAAFFNLRVNGETTDYFKDFSSQIIDKRKKELAEARAKGETFKASNFLDFMLEVEHELENDKTEGDIKTKYISHVEIIAQCVLFFLAGYETTASTLTMAVYNLMIHQDIQERVYDEIVRVLDELEEERGPAKKSKLEHIKLDDLSRFELLGAVFDETVRIYAPANFIERTAVKDVTIATPDGKFKLDVAEGDLVHIPVYAVHRDERFFPDPEKFDPERFLPEREKEHHRYSYIPFGAGPRNCVARMFAIMEARMALIHCIYNFRFTAGSKTAIPPNFYNQGGFFAPKDCIAAVERREY